jgi:hypothetical protein
MSVTTGIIFAVALWPLVGFVNPDQWPILSRAIFTAQFRGWLAACALVPGSFETLKTAQYVAIAIPVNAIVYAILAFAVFRMSDRIKRGRSSPQPRSSSSRC